MSGLQSALENLKLEKVKKTWAQISDSYIDDPSGFDQNFKRLATTKKKDLPRSLVVDGQDVRKPESVIEAYKKRFESPPTPISSPKDAEFQKRVENRVEQFSKNIDNDEGNTKYNPDLNANFSRKEVKTGIGKGGSKKTPNDDGIMNEMLKKGGQRLLTALVMLMNILWMLEVTSEFWKLSVIKPVYKKGSPFNPKNYRPISLLSNLFKLYERLIDVRVRAIVGLPPEQCAYRTCFGTETELLRLSILFQYCKHRNIPIFVGFLDLEQAFERAWRVGILYQLWV